jgi:hypothetical protein
MQAFDAVHQSTPSFQAELGVDALQTRGCPRSGSHLRWTLQLTFNS